MFFVPPRLPPLGLDLVSLDLYGSVPTQGEGRTADGRTISVHYRGGYLHVRSRPAGAEEARDEDVLVDARIGPVLDGDITADQVCDLLGLSIAGRPVRLDAARRAALRARGYADVSGATTFWHRAPHLLPADANAVLAALRRRRPDTTVMRYWYDPAGQGPERGWRQERDFLGADEVSTRLFALLPAEDAPVPEGRDQPGGWATRVEFAPVWSRRQRVNPGPFGRLTVEGRSYELPHTSRTLFRGECPTDDADGLRFLGEVDAAIEECCSCRVARVDLVTGAVLGTAPDDLGGVGPAYRGWCLEAPNRLLGFEAWGYGEGPRIGLRPFA